MRQASLSRFLHQTLLAMICVFGWASVDCVVEASVLTFDAKTTNTTPLPVGYGDNITTTKVVSGDSAANTYGLGNGATPNIALDFTPLAPPGTAPPGADAISSFYFYDDAAWPKVAELYTAPSPNDINVFNLTFTPDPGFAVRINSFDLYDYPDYHNGENHTLTWRVLDGSNNVLASGGSAGNVPSTVGPTIVPVPSVMGSFFPGLVVLELTHSAGFGADLALDNVNFDQVPEPSGVCLAAISVMMLLRQRRRYVLGM